MKNLIEIKKNILGFRDYIKPIKRIVQKKSRKGPLYLSFNRVEFISRGFADELLQMMSGFELKGKKIKIIKLKPEIRKFINSVKKTRKRIKKGK